MAAVDHSKRLENEVVASRNGNSGEIGFSDTGKEISHEIYHRISVNHAGWADYGNEICVLPMDDKTDTSDLTGQSLCILPSPVDSRGEEVARIRKKYSAAYFNARLKISLIEARLASADGEKKKLLEDKLSAANDELASLDRTCENEIRECIGGAADSALALPIDGGIAKSSAKDTSVLITRKARQEQTRTSL